jgi:septin family protein
MIIGETGVGKSTWLHCFINYMQSISIEENNRYLLFDEEKLQQEYEKKEGKKKPFGCSVTDKLEIYDIKGSMLYNNPIRLIDTPGFGDTRGESYDERIFDDIKNLFESSKIDTLHAICIIFKGNETRSHDRTKSILNKLFSLFGKDLKK